MDQEIVEVKDLILLEGGEAAMSMAPWLLFQCQVTDLQHDNTQKGKMHLARKVLFAGCIWFATTALPNQFPSTLANRRKCYKSAS